MALAKSSRAPKEVRPLTPQTRLTMVFRELAIEGKRDWRNCWAFIRHAAENDADMQKVIECYDGLKPKERAAATPEYVCDLAGVNSSDMAAEVFREYLSFAGDAANLIAAAGLPDVVRKSIQVAKTNDGHRDRKMQFEHANFLPSKQGGGIHVNANANANAETKTANIVQAPELASMENDSMRATKFFKDTISAPQGTPAIAPARVPALGAAE